MTTVASRIRSFSAELPVGVGLVAVSKFHSEEAVRQAYDAGQRIFGESYVQELLSKQAALPADIQWHFIGHLQTNKVKLLAPFVALIHSADSRRLLEEINRQAERCGRTIPCLLQLHLACEQTKFGFTIAECRELLTSGVWKTWRNVRIDGLMCMASNTDDEAQVRREFSLAFAFYSEVKAAYFADIPSFCIRSWGMSDDYRLAIESGSTFVRIGSRLFGARNY